jgi:hypothetical protein
MLCPNLAPSGRTHGRPRIVSPVFSFPFLFLLEPRKTHKGIPPPQLRSNTHFFSVTHTGNAGLWEAITINKKVLRAARLRAFLEDSQF